MAMQLDSEQIQRAFIGAALGIVVLVIAIFGIAQSNDTPQQVFWATVKNTMNTSGLTITSTSTASGAQEKVISQLDFGQHPMTRVLTELSSGGAAAVTETLTTPKAQYTRYDSIHKLKNGKPENFSSILGLWAKVASYSGNSIPPTYADILLDQLLPLPMGNLSPSERADLFGQIQGGQIYTVNFGSTKRTTYQGRTAYVYSVSIQPVLYLQLIKSYAPELEIHQLDQLNPNNYDGQANVTASWTIDAKSKQLVKVDYGGRIETYGGWGLSITTPVPSRTVTATDLENRLSAVN